MSTSNCNHPTCDGAVCRRPSKPKLAPKPINQVSDSMKEALAIYKPAAKLFREENPICQIQGPDCTKKTDCVHHTKGRVGDLLLEEKYWMASCTTCNLLVESADGWARVNGFKLSKFKKEQ